ncbi:MAG: DUF6531 domain-containing protein, partial [Planctomycetota bacterium]
MSVVRRFVFRASAAIAALVAVPAIADAQGAGLEGKVSITIAEPQATNLTFGEPEGYQTVTTMISGTVSTGSLDSCLFSAGGTGTGFTRVSAGATTSPPPGPIVPGDSDSSNSFEYYISFSLNKEANEANVVAAKRGTPAIVSTVELRESAANGGGTVTESVGCGSFSFQWTSSSTPAKTVTITASMGPSTQDGPHDEGGPADCGGEGQQEGETGPQFSDPLNIATGEFKLAQTDLVLPGVGIDFAFSRNYRSKSGHWSRDYRESVRGGDDDVLYQPLGMNWDHGYNHRVKVEGAALIWLRDGRGYRFYENQLVGAGKYVRSEFFGVFDYIDDATPITYTDGSNTVYTFAPLDASSPSFDPATDAPGSLSSIVDRNGNTVSFTYGGYGTPTRHRLEAIETTRGNTVTLEYYDDASAPDLTPSGATMPDAAHLLWRVTDHAGRAVEYDYEIVDWNNAGTHAKEKLVRVRLPEIVDDPAAFPIGADHGRFAGAERRVWTFGYAAEEFMVSAAAGDDLPLTEANFWWGGQLETVTSPNGEVITRNYYGGPAFDEDPTTYADAYPFVDHLGSINYRVMRQEHGVDDSGTPHTYHYALTDPLGGVIAGPVLPDEDFSVWVNGRRGAVTRFEYESNNAYDDGSIPGTAQPRRELVKRTTFQEMAKPVAGATSWTPPTGLTPFTALEFERNDDWKTGSVSQDGGPSYSTVYEGDNAAVPDPLSAGAVRSRTRTSADGTQSTTESWEYGFTFAGGSGCGCAGGSFATAYQDARGLVTRYDHDASGNVVAIYHDMPSSTSLTAAFSSLNPSDASAVDEFEFNPDGQLNWHLRPATQILDSTGGTASHNRRDAFEYGSIVGANDYKRLVRSIVDAGASPLTPDADAIELETRFEYDIIGNVTKVIEPDGGTSVRLFNQARQLVREQRYDQDPDAASGAVLLAETEFYYDKNGNQVRQEVTNIIPDENGVDAVASGTDANTSFTTIHRYDRLDFRVAAAVEQGVFTGSVTDSPDGDGSYVLPDTAAWSISETVYDENQNAVSTSVRLGGTTQPLQLTAFEYDARNLLTRTTQGDAADADTVQLVTEYVYDSNGRRTSTIVNPGPSQRVSSVEFDVFDRVSSTIDPMGNRSERAYDANDNVVAQRVIGEAGPDSPGVTGSDLLSYAEMVYDDRDRVIETKIGLFDAAPASTATPMAFMTTKTVYNDDGSVASVEYPNAVGSGATSSSFYFYDTLGRTVLTRDAVGNETRTAYEADSSNVAAVESWERRSGWSSGQGDPNADTEVFRTTYAYDGLDRMVTSTEADFGAAGGSTNTTEMRYDSRGNVVRVEDPLGNVTLSEHDAMSRQTRTLVVDVNAEDGGGLETLVAYDAASRVASMTDDNGNTTSYLYDTLGRELERVMPTTSETY